MRWQTTAILAAILIAVGAFYYVYDVRMAPEREKEAARKGRLWTIEPADVNEVTIRRSSDTLTLKREGDRWQMLGDRKSTRLNSSHGYISYAVFCLKKKKSQLKCS